MQRTANITGVGGGKSSAANANRKDIFGYALHAYWQGARTMPHSIRRDDGDIDQSSLGIYFAKRLYPSERLIAQHVQGKVLDVGCGAGRHVLYFQERGFDVTGIDNSPLAIRTCKERGCDNVKVADAFRSRLPRHSFDTILLFGHNIGIAATLAGAKKLLESLRALVKNDGVLLLTSVDVTKTTNALHQKYHRNNRKAGKYIGEVTIRIEYGDLIGDWFQWLHVEPKVLRELARESGWSVQEVSKADDGEYAAVLKPC